MLMRHAQGRDIVTVGRAPLFDVAWATRFAIISVAYVLTERTLPCILARC